MIHFIDQNPTTSFCNMHAKFFEFTLSGRLDIEKGYSKIASVFSKDGFHESILLFLLLWLNVTFSKFLQNSSYGLKLSQKYTNAIKVTYNAHAYVNVLVVKMTVQTNILRKSCSIPLMTTSFLIVIFLKKHFFGDISIIFPLHDLL